MKRRELLGLGALATAGVLTGCQVRPANPPIQITEIGCQGQPFRKYGCNSSEIAKGFVELPASNEILNYRPFRFVEDLKGYQMDCVYFSALEGYFNTRQYTVDGNLRSKLQVLDEVLTFDGIRPFVYTLRNSLWGKLTVVSTLPTNDLVFDEYGVDFDPVMLFGGPVNDMFMNREGIRIDKAFKIIKGSNRLKNPLRDITVALGEEDKTGKMAVGYLVEGYSLRYQ